MSDPARTPCIPLSWLVAVLAGSALLVFAMMSHHGLVIAVEPKLDLLLMAIAGLGLFLRCGLHVPRSRAQRICRDGAEYVLLFTALCFLGAMAAYPVAASSRGFVDPALERIDHLLQFDWLAWYDFVATHPWLQRIERTAYEAIYVSPAILFGWFAATGQRGAARRFIAGFWIAAAITLVLFACLPCRGPLAMAGAMIPPYMPESALYQASIIPELRDHSFHRIALGSLRGLVGAPSFHTASAVLYIAAAWPIRQLRWPMLALNAAMLLATPVEGTHYLADILIGGAVAAVALALAHRLATAISAPAPRRRPVLATG